MCYLLSLNSKNLCYSLSLNKINLCYSLSRDKISRKLKVNQNLHSTLSIKKINNKKSCFNHTLVQSKNKIPFSMRCNKHKSLNYAASVVAIINISQKLQGQYRTCFHFLRNYCDCGSFIILEIFKNVLPLGNNHSFQLTTLQRMQFTSECHEKKIGYILEVFVKSR